MKTNSSNTLKKASFIACLFVLLCDSATAQIKPTDTTEYKIIHQKTDTIAINPFKKPEPNTIKEEENKHKLLEGTLIIIGTFALLYALFNLRGNSQ